MEEPDAAGKQPAELMSHDKAEVKAQALGHTRWNSEVNICQSGIKLCPHCHKHILQITDPGRMLVPKKITNNQKRITTRAMQSYVAEKMLLQDKLKL